MYKILRKRFPKASIKVVDKNYAHPSIDWLVNDFHNSLFMNWLFENKLEKWKPDFDCDNFSFLYYSFAQICHRKTKQYLNENKKPQGLSVGIMFYIQDKSGGHAINFVVTKSGEIIPIEPQNGKVKELSNSELQSCFFALC